MKPLADYRRKRHFARTPEPSGKVQRTQGHEFVVQKHDARRLHYDFRLELDGVLKSWAVPKGPSLNPADKRLAIQVEDHPYEYRTFEGTIPAGQYGAGEVIVWDRGTWEPVGDTPPAEQLERGELKFVLHGEKLRGGFVLVRLRRDAEKKEWLLIKHRDTQVDASWNVDEHPESVATGARLTRDKGLPSKPLARGKTARAAAAAEPRIAPKKSAGVSPTIPGAHRAAMPGKISVTLAHIAEKPFSRPDWLFEIKWDGVRTVAYIRDGRTTLYSRSGRDITPEFPELKNLAANLNAQTAVVDGEIVVLDDAGRSVFQRVQYRLGVRNPSEKLMQSSPIHYFVFDLLYLDGYDLRRAPLLQRKELLKKILRTDERVRFSEHQLEKGRELYAAAREKQLEGIIAKRAESPYTGGRTHSWLKFKIVNELDAVIGGWTSPRGSRTHFGALLLGLYDGDELQYIGSVGTGFDQTNLKDLFEKLSAIRTEKSPFREPPRLREKIEWVKPQLVARVKYGNWTDDMRLRVPVFLSLRLDGDAKQCTFEGEGLAAPNQQSAVIASPDDFHREEESLLPAGDEKAETRKKHGHMPSIASPKSHRRHSEPAAEPPKSVSRHPESASSADEGSLFIPAIEKQIREATGSLNLTLAGKRVHLTHLDKIYFPKPGLRKRDLLAYYYRIVPLILPYLKNRPLVLRRYPNGLRGKPFFQKEAPQKFPDWMNTAVVFSDERRANMRYFVANDAAALLYLTNLGCIDHNPWSSDADHQTEPDYVFFDLDPTPRTSFSTVLEVAGKIYSVLDSIGLRAFLKTSGATGFHIYIPLERRYTYAQTAQFAGLIARVVAAELPRLTTLERSISKRPAGRVLIDVHQNARGKPLAAVYSARATPQASVSAPVTPAELRKGFKPGDFTIENIEERIRRKGDLWAEFWSSRQTLQAALDKLGERLKRAS